MYFTRIEIMGSELAIEGRAKSEADLFSYIDKLNKNSSVNKAELEYSEKSAGKGSLRYKIAVSFK